MSEWLSGKLSGESPVSWLGGLYGLAFLLHTVSFVVGDHLFSKAGVVGTVGDLSLLGAMLLVGNKMNSMVRELNLIKYVNVENEWANQMVLVSEVPFILSGAVLVALGLMRLFT